MSADVDQNKTILTILEEATGLEWSGADVGEWHETAPFPESPFNGRVLRAMWTGLTWVMMIWSPTDAHEFGLVTGNASPVSVALHRLADELDNPLNGPGCKVMSEWLRAIAGFADA